MLRDASISDKRYNKSGAYAEQALSAIKVVKAFNQESQEVNKYNKNLSNNSSSERNQAILTGFSSGIMEALNYVLVVYVLFIGATMTRKGNYNDNVDRNYRMGDVFGIYFELQTALMALAILMTNVIYLVNGLKACYSIKMITEEEQEIMLDDPNSESVGNITDDIVFRNVSFQDSTRK